MDAKSAKIGGFGESPLSCSKAKIIRHQKDSSGGKSDSPSSSPLPSAKPHRSDFRRTQLGSQTDRLFGVDLRHKGDSRRGKSQGSLKFVQSARQ